MQPKYQTKTANIYIKIPF